MRKQMTAFFLFSFFVLTGAFPQTKNEAGKWFLQGNYAQAKPVFLKYLKRTPKDGSLNYRYAVCCLETGDTVDVEKYLQIAAERKISDAHRYLGLYYEREKRYEEAAGAYDSFLKTITGTKDSLRQAVEKKTGIMKKMGRMLKTTQKICFIDSIVVDKNAFLQTYMMGTEAGTVSAYPSQEKQDDVPEATSYENEMGDKLYYAKRDGPDGFFKLFIQQKSGDEWGRPQSLEELNRNGNQNYPFMLSDGVTLYYADDGDESIGGYDLFVTRYNNETGRFLLPENVGMPFNSTANDYLLAIDELNGLGWFATDRNQPEGKVCVYTFIYTGSREAFDYEKENYAVILHAACITSIADTQIDADAVRKAKQQLMMVTYSQNDSQKKKNEFLFVVDDLTDYTSLKDFRSNEAKRMYEEWVQRQKQYQKDSLQLEELRWRYSRANASEKQKFASQIITLEKKAEQNESALQTAEMEIRNKEKEFLTR